MPQSEQQEVPPPADSGLRCPRCEYNLTGLAENRCPECGEAFDPDRLRALLEGGPQPIPVWGDESVPVLPRFARTCLLTWFLPGRFSRTFPKRYDRYSAVRFRWSAALIAAAVFPVLAVAAGQLSLLTDLLVSFLAVLVGVVVCERILVAMFDTVLSGGVSDESGVNEKHVSDSWLGLIGCFRSFLALSTWSIASVGVLLPHGEDYSILAALAVGVWWWICLAEAVSVQPVPLGKRIGTILLIPVAAFGGVLVGAMTAILLAVVSGL